MSSSCLVTVVIPAYNIESWLPALFNGLDRQTFSDFETIFVNDGSTDGTVALLDAYAASRERVKVLHQLNSGAAVARNTGLDAASGEFIAFIDGDDTIGPSYLADLFSLATSLDLDVAMCNGFFFQNEPGDINNYHPIVALPKPEGVMSGADWLEATLASGELCTFAWATMVRREFLIRHAIRFKKGVCLEDGLWKATVHSRAQRVAYMPKNNYYYRLSPGSIMRNQSLSGKLRRIHAYTLTIEDMWQMVDFEKPRMARLLKRVAAFRGRIMLKNVAEIGSLRWRIAISAELRRRGFLARLFRDPETVWHRKQIIRAYGFSFLGALAGGTVLSDEGKPGEFFST